MKHSVFKTEEGRDKIRAYYNRVLSQFPFGQRYVETALGRTFLLTAGQESNPPVILLHGSCSNSAFWFPEIMALSNHFMVYAVDIIGEAGNSEEYRPELNSDAFALWMKDVLDALGLEKTALIGNSLGGWIALKFAIKYPDFVSKLILIAPAGLSEPNADILEKAKNASLQNETITVASPTAALGIELPKEVEEFINLIFWGYNPITEALPVFQDEQIIRLMMPILFIAGKNDIMVDAATAAQRLGKLIPNAERHLLENTGHMVPNALEYVLPFLTKPEAAI